MENNFPQNNVTKYYAMLLANVIYFVSTPAVFQCWWCLATVSLDPVDMHVPQDGSAAQGGPSQGKVGPMEIHTQKSMTSEFAIQTQLNQPCF